MLYGRNIGESCSDYIIEPSPAYIISRHHFSNLKFSTTASLILSSSSRRTGDLYTLEGLVDYLSWSRASFLHFSSFFRRFRSSSADLCDSHNPAIIYGLMT